MLSARGVSRASAILPSFHLKQFITFTNPVLIHKFLQCEILQRMLHRKTAFSGLTLTKLAGKKSRGLSSRSPRKNLWIKSKFGTVIFLFGVSNRFERPQPLPLS